MQTKCLFDLWPSRDQAMFKNIIKRLVESQNDIDKKVIQEFFADWIKFTEKERKIKLEEETKMKVIDILKNSTRGQRSTMEKEILRRFIVNNLTCIPKSISFSEMDQLCNELDWYPLIGRSIIFLQGDFGNVYYMIAGGRVGLYLEPSKDREMVIAREFGHLRSQPYHGTDEQLKGLGNNIFNLPKGAGFGEYAILATTNKIRSAAAVSIDDDSFLLVMHAETYNNVLRQHHYRQKQLSSATNLLSELPLFKNYNYSRIAAMAYTLRSQTYSPQSKIVNYGDIINNVFLVASGQVKVFAPPSKEKEGNSYSVDKIIEKRIPKLAVAILGRGQIIGEIEVQKNLRTFQMSYEAYAASTELLEMPATVFKENVATINFHQNLIYKNIEKINDEREQNRVGRLSRAYDAMKGMMGGITKELKSKESLENALPILIEPPKKENSPLKESPILRRLSLSNQIESKVQVTRKASFAVNLSEDEMVSPSIRFSGRVPFDDTKRNKKGSISENSNISSPSAPDKSKSFKSPRKSIIRSIN